MTSSHLGKPATHSEDQVKIKESSLTAPDDEVVTLTGLRAPERNASGGSKGSHSANVKGGKLVHRKGRLVSESSSEEGDQESPTSHGGVDTSSINSPGHGRPTTTAAEEQALRGGSKGAENPLRSFQKGGALGGEKAKTSQTTPLTSNNKPAAGSAANTTKLRLVDIDFTGGRAKALASKQPPSRLAPRKPVPSAPVKKPDSGLPKPPTNSKISPRQQGGNLLMVSGVVDKALYSNHDKSPAAAVLPAPNGRKDLHVTSHAHKDAILSAKFPQLKRKMLSEQLDPEAPVAKVKKLLS